MNSNNPYNQFNPDEVLRHLKGLHPNLKSLNKIRFPIYRTGYEWGFGNSTIIPRMFTSKASDIRMNIKEFMGSKLAEIASMPHGTAADKLAQASRITSFAGSYQKDYILNQEEVGRDYRFGYEMPKARAMGWGSYYIAPGLVQDVNAKEGKQPLNEFANKVHAEDWTIDPHKIDQYMYQTKKPTDLMFGFQGIEALNKFTTLINQNILGYSSSKEGPMRFGAEKPSFSTGAMIENAQAMSSAFLYHTGDEHIMAKAARLNNIFTNTGVTRMVQFSNSARMSGDPLLYRAGTWKGLWSNPLKETVLKEDELDIVHRVLGLNLRAQVEPGVPQDMSISSEAFGGGTVYRKNASQALLTEAGMSSARAKAVVNIIKARRRGDVHHFSTNIGELQQRYDEAGIDANLRASKVRHIYSNREKVGPGSKFSTGYQKALGAEVDPNSFDYIAETEGTGNYNKVLEAIERHSGGDLDAMKLAINKLQANVMSVPHKDEARHMAAQFTGAYKYLTDPKYAGSKRQAKQNAAKVAEMMGGDVQAIGTQLHSDENIRLTQEHITGITDMLKRKNPIYATALKNGRMPLNISVLGEVKHMKHGNIIGVTINDLVGLKLEGLGELGKLFAEKMAANPHGNQFMDVLGYMNGRLNSINAMDISAKELLGGGFVAGKGKMGNWKKSLLFNPDMDMKIPYMVNLAKEFTVDTGGGYKRTLSSVPFLSPGAKGMTAGPNGLYKSPVSHEETNLLRALGSGKGDIQPLLQKYFDAVGNLGGKQGLADKTITRTRAKGSYGALGFLSPEAEDILEARHGERGGWIGVNETTAKKIFPTMDMDQIRYQFDRGIFLADKRYPEAPRGIAVGRAMLIDKELTKTANYGKTAAYRSAGLGTYYHGDIDQDMVSNFHEWANNYHHQDVLRAAYYEKLPDYQAAGEQAIQDLKAGKLLKKTLTPSELAERSIVKSDITKHGFILGVKTFEGAKELGLGDKRASDLARVLFTLSEAGINAKSNESALVSSQDIYSAIGKEDTEKLHQLMGSTIDELYGKAQQGRAREGFIKDLMSSLRAGQEVSVTNKTTTGLDLIRSPYSQHRYNLNYGKGVHSLDAAFNVSEPSTGSVMEGMVNSGTVRGPGAAINQATQSIGGGQNKAYRNAAKEGRAAEGTSHTWQSIGRMGREAVGDFAQGLREGRGWTSIAAGAVILAGVGLSLKKPGNIIVNNNETVNEARAPIVQSRKQQTNRVMTEGQYRAIIKVRDVRKVDRSKFVDLSEAISGKYSSPSKVQVNLKDDTNDIDYERVFNNAYRKAMRGN